MFDNEVTLQLPNWISQWPEVLASARQRLSQIDRVTWLLISLSGGGWLVAAVGLVIMWRSNQQPVSASQVVVATTAGSPGVIVNQTGSHFDEKINQTLGQIQVDVSGAVRQPGIYQLPLGSRIADAVNAAGGLTDQVDPVYVSRQLNLSTLLTDETKLYLPEKSSVKLENGVDNSLLNQNRSPAAAMLPPPDLPTDTNLTDSSATDGLISINTATSAQLESLPGIGAKRATDIISHRPYQSLNELVTKKVISQSVWENIKELVTL